MRPAVALAALALTGAIVVGSVQLADPRLGDEAPPEVDFSAAPSVVAADAATRLEHVDYAYRLDLADDRDGPWEQVRVAWIDQTDHQYRKVGPLGNRGVVIYGNDAGAFVRPGLDGSWRFAAHPDVAYPVETLSQPFVVDRIATAGAVVVAENRSIVVIRLDSNPLKIVEQYPGNATLYVRKDDAVIVTVLVTYDTGPSGVRYLRFQLADTSPAVERPADLGSSPREFGWDLIRGPLFRPFAPVTP